MGTIEKFAVNRAGHSHKVASRAERLMAELGPRPGQRYLEIGSGNGATAVQLARIFCLDVTGVDVDPVQTKEAIARAAGEGIRGVRFMTADATSLPFTDGAFDFVATNKTTHHIPDWRSAVEEMLRVLAPGGYLIYTDLVMPAWAAHLGEAVAPGRAGYPNRKALDRLLAGNVGTQSMSGSPVQYSGVFVRT